MKCFLITLFKRHCMKEVKIWIAMYYTRYNNLVFWQEFWHSVSIIHMKQNQILFYQTYQRFFSRERVLKSPLYWGSQKTASRLCVMGIQNFAYITTQEFNNLNLLIVKYIKLII